MNQYTLDDLTLCCGYFNGATTINSGYGCDHKSNKDFGYVNADDGIESFGAESSLRKAKFGYRPIISKKMSDYVEKALLDDALLLEINLKRQGKCLSHCCPIASSVAQEHESSFDGDTIMQLKNGIVLQTNL